MKGKNILNKSRIATIWENRSKIFEGFLNTFFKKKYVEKIAADRDKICRTNSCGLYSPKGEMSNCFVSGQPCCGGCGCKLSWKHRSLASHCYLKDIGETPLWDAKMTQAEENKFREKTGLKND